MGKLYSIMLIESIEVGEHGEKRIIFFKQLFQNHEKYCGFKKVDY